MGLEHIGENVKRIREMRGMTQTALANECGLGRTTVYRIETGKSLPSGYALEVLTKALSCSVADLFEE